MCLGTWQGFYVFEHRALPHRRSVVLHLHWRVSIMGKIEAHEHIADVRFMEAAVCRPAFSRRPAFAADG